MEGHHLASGKCIFCHISPPQINHIPQIRTTAIIPKWYNCVLEDFLPSHTDTKQLSDIISISQKSKCIHPAIDHGFSDTIPPDNSSEWLSNYQNTPGECGGCPGQPGECRAKCCSRHEGFCTRTNYPRIVCGPFPPVCVFQVWVCVYVGLGCGRWVWMQF